MAFFTVGELLVICVCAAINTADSNPGPAPGNSPIPSQGRSPTGFTGWSINPQNGIQAGGSPVTITQTGTTNELAKCVNNAVVVSFGSTPVNGTFRADDSNTHSVVCYSPLFNSTEAQRIVITCNGTAVNMSTNLTYQVRANPNITSITPQASIIAGGITQTMVGSSLDVSIRMKIDFDGVKPQTSQPPCVLSTCYTLNSNATQTCLKCRVVSLSEFFTSNKSRVTESSKISSHVRNVNVTFSLDNWSYSTYIRVFLNPGVQRLSPDPQDFVVNDGRRIETKVFWPEFNISRDDVTVDMLPLHTTRCGDVTLTTSALSCKPSLMSQQITRYGTAEEKQPMIQVTIGYDVTSVGQVNLVVEESFNVIIIVMIALISFVIALSFCFGCMALCHSRLQACCPSCYGGGYGDGKGIGSNGASDGPRYHNFEEENAGGKSSGHSRRRGKAEKYEMSGSGEGGEVGSSRHKRNKDGDIEIIGKTARDEL